MSAVIPGSIIWKEQARIENRDVWLGVCERTGRWFAMSEASPYFCFEEDGRLAAIDLASRVLIWYRERPKIALSGTVGK